jgi:hypothetical protein
MPLDPMVKNIMFFHGHKLMVRSKYTIFGRNHSWDYLLQYPSVPFVRCIHPRSDPINKRHVAMDTGHVPMYVDFVFTYLPIVGHFVNRT